MPARTKEQQEIHRHGRLAGQRGQPHYDNPYARYEYAHELWLEGWRIGRDNSFPTGRRELA